MNKKEEKKITDQIVKLIGDNIKDSDYILITDLIDWIKISEQAKIELLDSTRETNKMSWQILTTIAMSSKQIQNLMQRLNITPDKRAKNQKSITKEPFSITDFLNDD
jgi:hypothetical protein